MNRKTGGSNPAKNLFCYVTCWYDLYRVGQKQLDDLHLAPCQHLCRWRGETHIAG